jgi:hypothetical protein
MPGRDRVTPNGKTFFKQIDELKKLQVRVGFQQGSESEDGADLVDIAAWNEMGTDYIPPRPFLRQSVDNNGAEIAATCRRLIAGIVKGNLTARKALEEIGVMQKRIIQRTIKEGGFTPNAPITIEGGWLRRKGGKAVFIKGKGSPATPLIDTGRMRQSVNFVITEKGGD